MKINLGGVVYTRLVDILAAAIIIFRNYSKAKKLFEEYKPEISDKKIKDYK